VSGLIVRRIVLDDVEALRKIRLEGITRHPEAFSRDPEREAGLTSEQWHERIAQSWWFVCLDGDDWAGIASFSRDPSPKTAHVGSFGAMYVREAWRGKGAGDALVTAAIDEAEKRVEMLILTVNAENKAAIALYQRHGFAEYGRAPRALKIGERYYDEIEMVRMLTAPLVLPSSH
jgi:RimJ/RimL family protein N-acetyltransferase